MQFAHNGCYKGSTPFGLIKSQKIMVDDKVARRSLWVGELACSSRAYHMKGVMAEWSCEVLLILFTEVQFLLIPY